MKIDSENKGFTPKFSDTNFQAKASFGSSQNLSMTNLDSEEEIGVEFSADSDWDAIFELTGGGSGDVCKVLYHSSAYWNSRPDLIGQRGFIYIYSDWGTSPDGRKVAGFKVGDGETLLADIIFTDQMWDDHIKDAVRHITQEERERWNNKVTCSYVENLERIIFSK